MKIKVDGMHCKSCEIVLNKEVMKIDGIESCEVSSSDGTLEYISKDDLLEKVKAAIVVSGYVPGDLI